MGRRLALMSVRGLPLGTDSFPSHVMMNLTSIARIRQELAEMQKQ
jgi:hypothetical protein